MGLMDMFGSGKKATGKKKAQPVEEEAEEEDEEETEEEEEEPEEDDYKTEEDGYTRDGKTNRIFDSMPSDIKELFLHYSSVDDDFRNILLAMIIVELRKK